MKGKEKLTIYNTQHTVIMWMEVLCTQFYNGRQNLHRTSSHSLSPSLSLSRMMAYRG